MTPSTSVGNTVIEGYLKLVDSLSESSKLALVKRLNSSIEPKEAVNDTTFKQAFGAFVSDQTAEELIEELRRERTFNRHTESF